MRIFILFLSASISTSIMASTALDIASNGMLLQKYRLKVIAENIANVSTHMTDRGEPYRRKYVVVTSDPELGARARGVAESNAPFGKVYDPSHIYTDQNGYLRTPNFEVNDEMVNLSYTNLMYEANTTVFKSTKQMIMDGMEILK